MPRALLLSHVHVRRTLTRLAYEVVERNRGAAEVELFGIRRRGVRLAEMLGEMIQEVENHAVPIYPLDVSPFRDDLESPPPVTPLEPAPNVTARHAVIIDDVLFTGRTARAAIEAVLYYGRPASIQLAVLIDRGHREFPIRPDYVGRQIPTKHRERVVVDVADPVQVYLEE